MNPLVWGAEYAIYSINNCRLSVFFKNIKRRYMSLSIFNSTFPPCILSCEASYGVYLPSAMHQSQGMFFYFSGKGVVVGVCVG